MRVLVVDDEPLVRRAIERALALDKHAIECVATGAEALRAHRAQPFPLALIDINLGDCTGTILALRLTEIRPLRIILMSGHPEFAGWDGAILMKPFRVSELRMIVSDAIDGGEAI